MKTHIGLMACAMLLASCARLPPPATVISTLESPSPAVRSDVSGNPAIHVGRPREPGLTGVDFVVGASNTDGLLIHDMQGSILQRTAGARLTDLDIASLPLAESYSVVMGGPERAAGRTRVVLFRLDRGADQPVRRWDEIATDLRAPAGFCMRQVSGVVQAIVFDQRGEVRRYAVAEGPDGQVVADEVSRFRIDRPGRGCAIDGGGGLAYFSHARDGFWSYRFVGPESAGPVRLRGVAPHPLPRSTGVSFLTDRDGRFLISQDQDQAAFSVWRLGGAGLTWRGRFEVREQPAGRAVRTLVGIDAYGDGVGSFPDGLVVVQDQANDGSPNLKYIDWAEVKRSLGF